MHISVVIPAFNEERSIALCLRHIFDQTMPPYEVIVVDNNSTDRTMRIARRFPVRIVHERHQGMTHARNAGYDAARGEVIAHCDADTLVPRSWIASIHQHFSRRDCDALTGPAVPFHMPLAFSLAVRELCTSAKVWQLGHPTLQGCNKALRRSLWRDIREEICTDDREVHEDLDLAIHIHAHGARILWDPTLIVRSSGRRMLSHPWSFFVEYPARFRRTLRLHSAESRIPAWSRPRLHALRWP